MLRLNKYIATNFGVSRREADELIAAGKVLVNNKPAIIGTRVEDGDEVVVDGKKIEQEKLIYLALNKPVDYVCSRKRQGDTPTMYELLPEKYQSLKSVGRLDKNSSGLILLTNDGDFAYQMTHPKFIKTKVYEVLLDRPLEPFHQQMVGDFGIDLPDGRSKLGLERLDDGRAFWRVTMSEGRNRQIRRTFEAVGYKVKKLHRTDFGPYHLDGLESGQFVEIRKVNS